MRHASCVVSGSAGTGTAFHFLPEHRLHAFGFHPWKHSVLRAYARPAEVFFHYGFQLKHLKALNPQRDICCVWSSHPLADKVALFAEEQNGRCFRVEDGFLRSVGLGCLFVRPWSLVFDSCGIYYDPSKPSDLENILQCKSFSVEELRRARRLIATVPLLGLTKYNAGSVGDFSLQVPDGRPVILVPGQVEDDASISCGCAEIHSNLQLLRRVRELNPSAWILYKPHPDLQFTKKHLQIPKVAIMAFADQMVTDISISDLLPSVDSVHTMTSLTGFEALLYGKEVHCFGLPFYAGWGLTQDHTSYPQRSRRRTLEELVAAAYIDYPRYYHWGKNQPCEVEEVLLALQEQRGNFRPNWKQKMGRRLLNGFRKIRGIFA
jgi:capsular polysaccharide export protein